jgi:formylglycine-generating enzyme required for sulfatase activity
MQKTLLIALTLVTLSFTLKKKITPPGTVYVKENFYADVAEVSNFAWLEYENDIKNKFGVNSQEYKEVLPDTTVWRSKKNYNEPYVQYYHRHIAYRDYPVVGITQEQAINYCKWRTEKVKSFYFAKHKKELNIRYRLPSEEEWDYLNSFTYKKTNHYFLDTTETVAQHPDVTRPVHKGYPNKLKLYNLVGNVAEMVAEPNICKGGGFLNRPWQIVPGKQLKYNEPKAWLGFRCVCDYIIK